MWHTMIKLFLQVSFCSDKDLESFFLVALSTWYLTGSVSMVHRNQRLVAFLSFSNQNISECLSHLHKIFRNFRFKPVTDRQSVLTRLKRILISLLGDLLRLAAKFAKICFLILRKSSQRKLSTMFVCVSRGTFHASLDWTFHALLGVVLPQHASVRITAIQLDSLHFFFRLGKVKIISHIAGS